MVDSDEDAFRAGLLRTLTTHAINDAFSEHVKLLFANFVRHIGVPDQARGQFRKDMAIAKQVHSEMLAIANEGSS